MNHHNNDNELPAYIVVAAFVPLMVFGGVMLAVMLGYPPSDGVINALLPGLFWYYLAMFALLLIFGQLRS